MKKFPVLSAMLCCALLGFAQVKQKPITRGGYRTNQQASTDSWKDGSFVFSSSRGSLALDTNLVSFAGSKPLHVAVTSNKAAQFKFKRDNFDISTLNDFKLDYSVRNSFQGGNATFCLYLYSGKLIIYKRDFTVMFDGRLRPTVVLQSQ